VGGGTSADGVAMRSAPAHAQSDGATKKGREKPCERPAADKNPKCTGERPGKGGGGGNGGDEDADSTCANGGAREGGPTFAEEFAGGGVDETGPVSGQIHGNEGSAGEAAVVFHEVSCGVAAFEAAAGQGGEPPAEEPPAEEPRDASCASGGLQDDGATFANQFGDGLRDDGPLSGQLHGVEKQAAPAAGVIHELGCGVAALESQAPAQ
jgi:hypothetical protein